MDNNLFSDFGEDEFQLTENGEHLLNGTEWIETYEHGLDDFDL